MKSNYQTNWIVNDTIGIFLSIAVSAGILAYEVQWLGLPTTTNEKLTGLGLAIGGGLIAGTILAWFQYRILKKRYENLNWSRWWRNTVIAYIGAWVLAIVPSFFATEANSIGQVIPPFGIPTFTVEYGSILFGGIMGAMIGCAQWFELRRHRQRASGWVGTNTFGWAGGLLIIAMIGLVFQGSLPTTMHVFVAAGLIGGLLAAIAIAVSTSLFFTGKVEGSVA